MAKGMYDQFLRYRIVSAIDEATPERPGDWNQGYGQAGWRDWYEAIDGDGLNVDVPLAFPAGRSGERALNSSKPIPGAQGPDLGTLSAPFYPELGDGPLTMALSDRTVTPTPGVAALASTLFSALATLDTQPSGPEMLEFTITGATTSTGAIINVLVDDGGGGGPVIKESISIPDALLNGVFYTQGAYDATVSFTVEGTNDGNVVVAGIQYTTIVYRMAQDTPFIIWEQAGRIESDPLPGVNTSEYFPGGKIAAQNFAFDRGDQLSMLMQSLTITGLAPVVSPASTFQNAASLYYRPFASWFGQATIDGVVNKEIATGTMNIDSGDAHFGVISGSRGPDNATAGWLQSAGDFSLIPSGNDLWTKHFNGTGFQLSIKFTSTIEIVTGVFYSVEFKFEDCYIETYARGSEDPAQGASLTYRTVNNSVNAGPVEVETVCRMPAL